MTDSTPEQTEPVSDTPPKVPPARKPTAMEVATEARELAINALEAVSSGGTVTLTQGDALTAEERELLARLPGISDGLNHLSVTLTELDDREEAHRENFANGITGLSRAVDGLAGRLNQLVDDTSTTLGRIEQLGSRLEQVVSTRPPIIELDPITTNVPMVYGAVLDVMRMVTELDKDGRVSGSGGNYRYRSIDAAMDAVGTAMRTVGLILGTKVLGCESRTDTVQEMVKGELKNRLWTTVRITMAYTFVSPDDGSTHTLEMVGEGRDLSDKATSKAVAMAFKYALLHGLCIPIEGLPESDGSTPIVEQNVQRQAGEESQAAPARPKKTREEYVKSVADGLDALHQFSLAEQRERFNRITAAIDSYELWNDPIPGQGGYTLRALVSTVQGTLPGLTQPPPAAADEPPWSNGGAGQHADPSQYA